MSIWKVLSSSFLLFAAMASAAVADGAGETSAVTSTALPPVVVYKNPSCGCCVQWMEHMRAHGFTVESVLEQDVNSRKQALKVPPRLWSCHTAVIDGYVIEGHVPAADVERLLQERPEARGLAVPGMPLGSAGMEGYGGRQAYDVLLFDAAGNSSVFSHYSDSP